MSVNSELVTFLRNPQTDEKTIHVPLIYIPPTLDLISIYKCVEY